jgi:AcrR family transcriptional regulator
MDRRLRKTEEAIQNAFIELANKESYDRIKLSELIDLADLNKSTFYLHYQSLEGVSYAVEDRLVAGIVDAFAKTQGNVKAKIIGALDYVQLEKRSFLAVLSASGSHFYKKLIKSFRPFVLAYSFLKGDKETVAYSVGFIFGGCYGAFREWIYGTNRFSKEKLADTINELIDKL